MGIKGKVWKICISMLSNMQRRVLVNGRTTSSFSVLLGLAQGSILSPLLYSCFIDGLVDELRQKGFGVDVYGHEIAVLLYADDLVLLASSHEELQSMLDCVSNYAAKWQFRYNARKSGVVVMGDDNTATKAKKHSYTLGGESVPIVTEYKYLGLEFGRKPCKEGLSPSERTWHSAVNNIAKKARSKANFLMWGLTANKTLSFSSGLKAFNAQVLPVLEYGNAIWGILCNDTGLKLLEKVQYRFGRKLLRMPRSTPEIFVSQELGLSSVKARAVSAALKFFGKLCNLPSHRLLYDVFRYRCAEVDAGGAYTSWCRQIRSVMISNQLLWHWDRRRVCEDWRSVVKNVFRRMQNNIAEQEIAKKTSLALYEQLKSAPGLEPWYKAGLWHPGVRIKLQLRANVAPLAPRVCDRKKNAKWPITNRQCQFCASCSEETVEHLLGSCPRFHEQRQGYKQRLIDCVRNCPESTDILRIMNSDNGLEISKLVLGQQLQKLPVDVAKQAELIGLNYIKLIWAKRMNDWLPICEKRNPWEPLIG
jgi:hypothetical protein